MCLIAKGPKFQVASISTSSPWTSKAVIEEDDKAAGKPSNYFYNPVIIFNNYSIESPQVKPQ